jgi:hypothetical protein
MELSVIVPVYNEERNVTEFLRRVRPILKGCVRDYEIIFCLDPSRDRPFFLGIVGRDGGYTALVGDAVVIVPTVNPGNVTPPTEAFQAVIRHLLVSHPLLKKSQTKWEGVVAPA